MKEQQEYKQFCHKHPHHKSGFHNEDLHTVLKETQGDLVKLCLRCFEMGFMRGMRSKEYYLRKEGRLS